MSATDTTYNGWTNYETWGAALILDNDEGTYRMTRDRVEEIAGEDDDRDRQVYKVAEYIEGLVATLCGLGDESEDYGIPEPSMMAQQLLNLGAIDYREIAEDYLSELG